jgi:1-acyl-sn-glycerol-3-phosphate acyltransferase
MIRFCGSSQVPRQLIVSNRQISIRRAAGATAALIYYGFGSLTIAAVAPVLRLWGPEDVVQAWVRRGHQLYIFMLVRFGLIRIDAQGLEELQGPGPMLIVSNHPSLFDAPMLGALLPQVDFIVSQSRASNPILAGIVRQAGYLTNRDGVAVVEESVRRLDAGRKMLVFPEGTRSPASGLGKFHRGAAHAALRTGCDLLPVVITVSPRKLMKGQKWYDIPEEGLDVTVRVLEPISPSKHLTGGETVSVAARKVTNALRKEFERKLYDGE